jgi:hypothetical protein
VRNAARGAEFKKRLRRKRRGGEKTAMVWSIARTSTGVASRYIPAP